MSPTHIKNRRTLIEKAKKRGENALVDPMPDMTPEGIGRWKENVKEYFIAECEEILEREENPELRREVVNAMKEGFSELIESQHDVPLPDSGVETAHTVKEDAFHEIHDS